jgi:hypothetical protein
MILMRTVRRDFARYEERLIEGQYAKEESGWTLVSGDVLHAPPSVQALAEEVLCPKNVPRRFSWACLSIVELFSSMWATRLLQCILFDGYNTGVLV